MEWGWIGGITGCVIGLAGGIIGTYFSIKNTRPGRERSFMIKYIAAFWAIGIAVLALMLLAAFDVLPEAFYWVAWIMFMCLLGPSIVLGNRRLAALRADESEQSPDS